ncbi:DNA damage-inducible protein 1 [Talaromyces pinophilus]|nr:DNA damage-inducible protein 1 [Talaromyces pinophilus]
MLPVRTCGRVKWTSLRIRSSTNRNGTNSWRNKATRGSLGWITLADVSGLPGMSLTIEGVGAETLIGRVHSVQIKVGNIFRACSLTIIAGNHIGLHLGLDILQRYQASIDLRRNVLVIQNQAIRFLSEDEIPKGFEDE